MRTGYSFGAAASATSNPSATRLQRSPSPTTVSTNDTSTEYAGSSKTSQSTRNNGTTEKPNQASSSYGPSSAITDFGNERSDRRPSAASAATASSQGSKSSSNARFRKHLPRIFGEDYKGSDTENTSDTNLPAQPFRAGSWERSSQRSRKNNSSGNASTERPISPGAAQPNAPPPSDVTPWMYQSFNVSICFRLI